MNTLIRIIITVTVLWIAFKWGETSGYEKCAKDVPRAFHEAIKQEKI